MASGALPPGFPAIEIEGEHYWDGGLVSNTPLQWVLECADRQDTLAFQVDVWSARGAVPRTLGEVATRQKEIQYSSRTRANSDRFKKEQKLRNALADLISKLPDQLRATPEFALLNPEAGRKVYNIIQLIYRSKHYEGESKDFEFSASSMEDHWAAGLSDTIRTLRHPEVLERPTQCGRRLHVRSRDARADVAMNATEVRERAFAMPLTQPAYPPGPYRFYDREFLIITYRTDREKLRALVPEPLEVDLRPGEIRVHPDAEFHRLRRLHRGGPGDPGQLQGAGGQLHAQHVPQRPSADRRRPRVVGLSQEARRSHLAHGNRHVGRHARLRTRPRRHRHHGIQAQAGRRRCDKARARRPQLPAQDHPARGRQPADLRAGRISSRRHSK